MKNSTFYCFFAFCAIISSVSLFGNNDGIEKNLNICMTIFNEKQHDLYDTAEQYLKSVECDSIEGNIDLEMLYYGSFSLLYAYKYNDYEKFSYEMGILLDKLSRLKNIDEYRSYYRKTLSGYGFSLINLNQFDKAEETFNKLIIEVFDDEDDMCIYDAYMGLSRIYELKNELILAEECHYKSQEYIVRSFIRNHPENSFYMDNFRTLKMLISQLENNNQTKTEDYINCLCSLGTLLYKANKQLYIEPMLIFWKALGHSDENGLMKCNGLEDCYINLLDIYITNTQEPIKTQVVEGIISHMVYFYTGLKPVEDIFMFVASEYGVTNQYDKAIEYELKALNALEKEDKKNNEQLRSIYKRIVMDYLNLKTDDANQKAFYYLQKLKNVITPGDEDYYDWYLEYNGCVLRYLYKNDDAIRFFRKNLSYFNKKYGKYSNQYISTLNQLSMCYPYGDDESMKYLLEAKTLVDGSKNVSNSTIRGICINFVQNYIVKGKYEEAMPLLKKAELIEKEVLGDVTEDTKQLITKCTKR